MEEKLLLLAKAFHMNSCYEAMPTSSKMVTFDTSLRLDKAFRGLVYQNTRHVLLIGDEGKMVGILSITDFIRVLLRMDAKRKAMGDNRNASSATARDAREDDKEPELYNVDDLDDLGGLTIKEYRAMIEREGKLPPLVSIAADCSLLDAARFLSLHRIHRLPVFDPETKSPLFILTHKRLLSFLYLYAQMQSYELEEWLSMPAKALNVGTWKNILVVNRRTPIRECLHMLLNRGVSGLPVVDCGDRRVIAMFSRFDAIRLIVDNRTDQLDRPLGDLLDSTKEEDEKNPTGAVKNESMPSLVVSVPVTASLWQTIVVLVERSVHRVCAVNQDGTIEGVISLSDVINFLIVRPGTDLAYSQSHPSHHSSGLPSTLSDSAVAERLQASSTALEELATAASHCTISSAPESKR